MSERDYMTTKEAASELGVDESRIRQMIGEGKLTATRFGRVHMIERQSVEAAKNRKRRWRKQGD